VKDDLGLPHGVIGMEITSDAPTSTTIRDGNEATPSNLAQARMQWPEARRGDFQRVGKRRWRDCGSGTEYAQFSGAALLSIGEATRHVVAFFIDGARLVFVERLDVEPGVSVNLTTPLRSGEVVDGQIRWTT
jgi:hypothetical protein